MTDTRYLWRVGQTIRYCFLPNVPMGWRNNIETTAREWTKYANLNFDFSTDCERADYKIGADPTQVASWSCAGISRPCSRNGADMNFLVNDRGTILHEFGHSIGLIHEHKSPLFAVPWDRERVFAELRAAGNNWTDEVTQSQVMDSVSGSTIRASIFDPDSIMIYGINPSWVVGGAATLRKLYPNLKPNYSPSELSAADRLYIAMLYPPAGTPRSFAFAAAAPNTLVRKFGVFDGTTSTETEVVMQGWSIRSLFGGDGESFDGPVIYAVLADGRVGFVNGPNTGVSPPVGRGPFSPAETVFGSDSSRTYVATAAGLQVMSTGLRTIPRAVHFGPAQTFPTGLGPFTQACASRGDIFTLDATGALRRFRDLSYDGGQLALSPPKGEVVATGVSARAIACSDGKVFGLGVGDTAWVATPADQGYVVRTTGAASRYLRGLAVGGGGFAYAISDPPSTTVWKDSKFRGESWTIFTDQPQLGRWNDEISAIKVDPRSAVALYKDSLFRGQCLTVRGDVLQLSKTPIGNDSVSSLKLDATCEGPYTGALPAAVFTDSDGRSIEVYGDIPNLKARAFNDSVARILINPGTSLSLYKDKNYTGVCRRMQIPKNGLTITISGPTIASFGREITAIRLGSDPNCARVDL